MAAAIVSTCFAFPVFAEDEEEQVVEEQVEQEEPEEPEQPGEQEEVVIIEETEPDEIPELECIIADVEIFPDAGAVHSYDAALEGADVEGFYNRIRSIVNTWNGEGTISFSSSQYKITSEMVQTVNDRFYYECPDCYVVNKIKYYSSGGTVSTIQLVFDEYTMADKRAFDNKVSEIISRIDPLWSDAEKVLFLHDYIVTHCDYDVTMAKRSNTDPYHRLYTAYDCLVNGSSVCEGYAKAFSVLCSKVGIESYGVTSRTNNHAWNLVKFGGKFYYIDCTGDDPASTKNLTVVYPGYCRHRYLLCSKQGIEGIGNHQGTDWLLNGYDECYDYSTGSEYDGSFSASSEISENIRSRMVFIGDSKWVSYSQKYISSGGCFKVYDFSTRSYSDFTITGIPSYNGICLDKFGGDLMVSNGDIIYRVNVSNNGLSGSAYSATFTNPYADSSDICGIDVVGDELCYSYGEKDSYGLYVNYGTVNKATTDLPFPDVGYGRVTECSLTLDGSVGINFRVALPQEFLTGMCSVSLVDEQTHRFESYMLNSLSPEPDGSYLFTYSLKASQMNDNVVLSLIKNGQAYPLKSADGVDCTDGFRYSVSRYVEKAKQYYGTDTRLVTLLDNMYEYGKCAQIMFGYNADGVSYDNSLISNVNSSTLGSYKISFFDQFANDGLSFYGASLVLRSVTSLNLYFEADGIDYQDFTFKVGSEVVDVTADGDYLKLTVRNIPAADLADMLKINVYDQSGRAAISINIVPLSYCHQVAVLHDQGAAVATDTLYDLVRLLYRYYQAADAYINKT